MKCRAILNNPVGLYKIVQTVEKLAKQCLMSFTKDEVRFVTYREDDSAIPTWVKINQRSLFHNYRLESRRGNEVHIAIFTHDLCVVLKGLQDSTGIQMNLICKGNAYYLNFSSSSLNAFGTTTDETSDIYVAMMTADKVSLIREPTLLGKPDTYIYLPAVSVLKPAVEKFKSLGKFMRLSANMNGKFKIEIETPSAIGEVLFDNLGQPELRGQEETRHVDSFSSITIKSEDLVHFLNCYHLNPTNVICSITNLVQLSFHVYLSIDSLQNSDAPIRTVNPYETTFTCHLPVYYE